MHMADALISVAVGGTMIAASGAASAYAGLSLRKDDADGAKIPMMAVCGAFVFAAQMINFTIPGTGSSGHITGGLLLAALLGGGPALLTIASALIIQCLLFADGGLLALGCNIFNMGVIPCLVVYPLLYKPITRKMSAARIVVASVCASVVALQIGAFGVVLETMASGIVAFSFGTFLLLMQPIHLAIGAVEGAITAAILCFVYKTRPALLERKGATGGASAKIKVWAVALAAAAVVGGVVSHFASEKPDGLEWSYMNAAGSEMEAPEARYDAFGVSVSGIVGGGLVFVLAGGVGAAIRLTRGRANKA